MSRSTRESRRFTSALALLLLLSVLIGCTPTDIITSPDTTSPTDTVEPGTTPAADSVPDETLPISSLAITNCDRATLVVGETLLLLTNAGAGQAHLLDWSASNGSASVSPVGLVTALEVGKVTITVTYGDLRARALIEIVEAADTDAPTEKPDNGETMAPPNPNPPSIPEIEGSPAGYRPAGSPAEALDRAERGELAGYPYVPDQAPVIAENRPMQDGKYIRNSELTYLDDDTYVVMDAYGNEIFRLYRGGGYITLEEIAAYLYAFGDVPANYNAGKKLSPTNSKWGQYLRLNHSKFSGNTFQYPYEPELPRISGCGGDLQYYEIDIGTTGTDCDPGYPGRTYNDGNRITRGAARIVYARFDANGNAIIDPDEKYVFYTYNHYNDFREYLGYYNGWGEMFGNITGGGKLSDKIHCSPTPYIATVLKPLDKARSAPAIILYADFNRRDEQEAA